MPIQPKKAMLRLLAGVLAALTMQGAEYYISPTGSDSNNGRSTGTPWLTPNHALSCGDTITAAAGTYSYLNFGATSWGVVTCAAGDNVAWLQCATFAACTITTDGTVNGMVVNGAYWGVRGWEINMAGSPASTGGSGIWPAETCGSHHIVIANNVINQAGVNGIGSGVFPGQTGCVNDYIAFIGNAVYFAGQWNGNCNSNLSIYQPYALDSLAGTHMYVAGNISWNAHNPNPCHGGPPTDAQGITFDTWGGEQGGSAYTQRGVIENNIVLYNGGAGISVYQNGTASTAIVRYNTLVDDASQNNYKEIALLSSSNVTVTNNLIRASASNAGVTSGSSSNNISSNWIYTPGGTACSGTGCGTNVTGTDPNFVSNTDPGAPSCGSATSVPNCMATVIANFAPQASGASAYGYQIPTQNYSANPYFPSWLCNVNLPAGLVSNHCVRRQRIR
jgi:hypothetical protein